MSNSFLSQEEINALLAGELSNEETQEVPQDNGNTEELTDIEKDLLGEIGNISMGSASTALYQIINQNVNITTPVVSLTTLKDMKASFETPNIILDVEYTEGIIGRNILVMRTDDAAVIANLMMGGDGKVPENPELSEIEVSAVQEAMNQMIGSAATSMATMFSRRVDISPPTSKLWKEKDEPITETLSEDEEIVRVSFRLIIGDLVDSNIMQILPLNTAKKIVSIMMGEEDASTEAIESAKVVEEKPRVQATNQKVNVHEQVQTTIKAKPIVEAPKVQEPIEVHEAAFETLVPGDTSQVPKNIDLILDVPLDISVVLGRTKKSIKDILNLSTGSLIELDKLAEEPVEILVNGKKIAYGEVVVVDENFGVRITSIVSNAERIKSLR
ncbi:MULTISPECIES: flagellar motor switch phosphatase FliY [unclassified Clostridium]|uniref:Flagellar motor switch protein FliN n=1 Tax=Clostridium botulinum (strain Eklund 17B / Type B) TaxID=935198 RepID=B2TLR1_CLOBB|nr:MULTISPECIES: flagellar motor switch phosphatase FliY [unclassified Clostridium]ACD24268.1 flagellar motor switch protein FliN [Clostridium botulinum B str. Eklund 17B (NRP)]MBN1044470.1 flagellar motor switch phosphatase FliY [Clostridium botulinum]MBN1051137.1 flagellar motor switch phosphatase FliY [Clostridium botulinum]MBN1054427.1 flagellar motor switch phosphatase FliY [Clostridium botulinum]MBY6976674.1 flagellar motor switch phosphatase FliY [Clostridium botulinum]